MIFQYQICSSLYLSQHVCMFLWYVAVRFGDMDVTIFFQCGDTVSHLTDFTLILIYMISNT